MNTEEYYGGTYPSPDEYEDEKDLYEDKGYDEEYYMDQYFEERYEFNPSDSIQPNEGE